MALEAAYVSKPDAYFTGARHDIIDRLTLDPDRAILQVGCGDGTTGMPAKQAGKCGRYVGVELDPRAADRARARLDEVHVGDIEVLALPDPSGSYDVVIASEVFEHLVDPWKVLARLKPLLKAGGLIFASSPNVSHRSIIHMLLRGDWSLTDFGPMDRTHLRWFTPKSYAKMFRSSGFTVRAVDPWDFRIARRESSML